MSRPELKMREPITSSPVFLTGDGLSRLAERSVPPRPEGAFVNLTKGQRKRLKRSNGIFIVAFGGKVQNEHTHSSLLPDLGELVSLRRLACIGQSFGKEVRVVLDGPYYSEVFGEDPHFTRAYNEKLQRWNNELGLGLEFIDPTQEYSGELLERKQYFSGRDQEALRLSGIREITSQLIESIGRNLSQASSVQPAEVAESYVVHKAALNKVLESVSTDRGWQKVTCGVLSGPEVPRVKLADSRIPPWSGVAELSVRLQPRTVYYDRLTLSPGACSLVKIDDDRKEPVGWFIDRGHDGIRFNLERLGT